MKTTPEQRQALDRLAEYAHLSSQIAHIQAPLKAALADLDELHSLESAGPNIAAMRLMLSEVNHLARQLKEGAVLPHGQQDRLQEIIELSEWRRQE